MPRRDGQTQKKSRKQRKRNRSKQAVVPARQKKEK